MNRIPHAATGAARVLVTGASGYLGRQVVDALGAVQRSEGCIVAHDLREPVPAQRLPGVIYRSGDIGDPGLAALLREQGIEVVVHLAAVMPGGKADRKLEYRVDVEGTRNVLEACVAAGVRQIVVSSSGAAYGYHADNPAWLSETDPLRGNREFAYSWHKRLVEEMLAEYRERAPQLVQTVLRVGTILGAGTANAITGLFEKARPLAIAGSDSPFVFIWDHDVVGAIVHAIRTGRGGIYNVAGDGALTIHEIAARMGKRCRVLPAGLLMVALAIGRLVGATPFGPAQLRFLRYRPVLDNRRLKEEFGYRPRKTSAEVFDLWWSARRAQPQR